MLDLKVVFGAKEWPTQVYFHQLDTVPIYLISQAYFLALNTAKFISIATNADAVLTKMMPSVCFFSSAALKLIEQEFTEQAIDIIHCHDWHTGTLLLLLNHDQQYRKLRRKLKTLFTIHNLDYQGVRPFEIFKNNIFLSFRDWFPGLYGNLRKNAVIRKILSTRRQKFSLQSMRSGINLADRINTVSPTYARK